MEKQHSILAGKQIRTILFLMELNTASFQIMAALFLHTKSFKALRFSVPYSVPVWRKGIDGKMIEL
jgi:hypothetical protein